MYTVRSNQEATASTRVGVKPLAGNWQANTVMQVDTELIGYYQEHSDVFEILGGDGALTEGVETASGVTAANVTQGVIQQTTFTLTDVAQTIPLTTSWTGTKIFTFPAGRILVLGVLATLAQKTTSAVASTIHASTHAHFGLGTTEAAKFEMDGTTVNLLPLTTFTTSATINVAGTAVSAALAASAQFDGTGTATPVYLNSAITVAEVAAEGTQTVSGTVQITWINLGDY